MFGNPSLNTRIAVGKTLGALFVCGGDKLVHGSGGDCPAAAE